MAWVLRIFFGLLALAAAAVAVLFLLPAERIAGLAADRFEAATGRAMTLEGDVRPTLWPELGVNTGPVTLANAAWSDAGPMLTARGLSIGIDMAALIGGDIRITRIEADAPQVLLERAADGRGNWEMAAAGTPQGGGAEAGASRIPDFTLERAVLTDASLTFADHAAGSRVALSGIDATLSLPEARGPADLRMRAAMNGQTFDVTARIGDAAGLLAGGAVPLTLQAGIGGSSVEFDGRAGLEPIAAGGRMDADLGDLAAVLALAGQEAPDLPKGLGRDRVAVTGDVTLTEMERLTLRDGTIRLDGNVLSGAADLTLAGRPRLTATLAAGALDLSALAVGDGAGAGTGGGAAAPGWSREPIDVSALQALDADVKLTAESVDLGDMQLGRTRLRTVLEAGRAVTEIEELQAYDGRLAGSVVVNSRGGLSARATLRGTGLQLKPLLVQLAGFDRLQTTGDLQVDLLGVGNSMEALMNSLSGTGRVSFGGGELGGLDLAGMLRTLDMSYVGEGAKTIFDSIGATFSVENGVLVNDDLAFLAPLVTAGGKGRVGIGAQTLDYRLEPRLLEGQNGGIRVPVLITGTWAKPKIRLDLEALARERLDVEAEKVKEKAETAVIQRLNDELGVNIEDKADIDDVLKKELEERATKGLLDLLGGGN